MQSERSLIIFCVLRYVWSQCEPQNRLLNTNKMCLAHLKSPLIECLSDNLGSFSFCLMHSLSAHLFVVFFFLFVLNQISLFFLCSLLERHHVLQPVQKQNIRTFTTFSVLFPRLLLSFSLVSDCCSKEMAFICLKIFILFICLILCNGIPLFIWRMNECIHVEQAPN